MNYAPWIDMFVYSLPILQIGVEGHLNILAQFGFISNDTQQLLFLSSCNQIWMRTSSIDATVSQPKRDRVCKWDVFGLTQSLASSRVSFPTMQPVRIGSRDPQECWHVVKRLVFAPHRPSWICRRDLLYCCLCWVVLNWSLSLSCLHHIIISYTIVR